MRRRPRKVGVCEDAGRWRQDAEVRGVLRCRPCRGADLLIQWGELASVPSNPAQAAPRETGGAQPFFADLYTFDWSKLEWVHPLLGALSVALCLIVGVAVGHPSAGLIAAGSAFTVGFGANQRIRDSRVWPMLAATAATAVSTVAGMTAGHRGFALLGAAAVWGFGYGLLTTKANGVSWVGQQAAVFLLVTSAFPTSFHGALERASLTLAGGLIQTFVMSVGLRMLPELGSKLASVPRSLYHSLYADRRATFAAIRELPMALPRIETSGALAYGARMALTLVVASEIYRRLGMQSGYWIPMTALLVQKPAFFETLTRGLLRVGGTIAGAVVASLLLAHIPLKPMDLAVCTAVCALFGYATIGVNYGLYSVFLTSYIVFLLGLNSMPGPEIARRRAYCTAIGAAVALVVHVDAVRRHRKGPVTS